MPELKPASASPLLDAPTPTTPTASPPPEMPRKPHDPYAKPSLDDKAEYLDKFGAPRRSKTYTHRMVLLGHAIEMPDELLNEPDVSETNEETTEEEPKEEDPNKPKPSDLPPEELRRRNAEFKKKCKEERQQWIDEADQRIVQRLTLWYDGSTVPVDADIVDVTENNTVKSPSKKAQAFIDDDGNLRRKSVPQVAIKIEDTGKEDAYTEVRPADTASPPPPPTAVPTSS